ncbi:transposase [Alteromonas sp. ASW11-130]|uniref:transposase n=1 Tax=Alteromonas sp. ASW11-130 TaxID=3015775 RepID=UPI002241EFE2|nr:transposase [Alteromonas sp. ASW11-130]MCW8090691.1 transposase [Alteromonas sp. ASW11-130]
MARKKRIGPAGFAQHVIQRGNNRAVCFACEEDYFVYIHWLKKFSQQFNVSIHAWVLMTNHVHLLCTPQLDNRGVSAMMQSLGRMYVRYFNQKYTRTGTLWEGRFHSSLVCTEEYLLTLYRYIELNPVRAKMVCDAVEYKWSSYKINALGVKSSLCTPHPIYMSLGQTKIIRLKSYRALFASKIPQTLIKNIQKCSRKELVLGNAKFKQQIEHLTGIALKNEKPGRPPTSRVKL